jgi:hypothetical protein
MNRNREVVILKNVKSDYIEEAILILKDGSAKDRGKALKEAEKIVYVYGKRFDGIQKSTYHRQKKKLNWIPLFISLGMLASIALLLVKLL